MILLNVDDYYYYEDADDNDNDDDDHILSDNTGNYLIQWSMMSRSILLSEWRYIQKVMANHYRMIVFLFFNHFFFKMTQQWYCTIYEAYEGCFWEEVEWLIEFYSDQWNGCCCYWLFRPPNYQFIKSSKSSFGAPCPSRFFIILIKVIRCPLSVTFFHHLNQGHSVPPVRHVFSSS